jgi:hypothetical protein
METLHCPGHHDLVLHVKNAYKAEDGIFYDARGYRDLYLSLSALH